MSTTRRQIKKSSLMFMLSMMAITLVFLVAILIVTVSYFLNKDKEPTGVVLASGEAIYTEEELGALIAEKEEGATDKLLEYIRSSMQNGKSTVSILRELYPEQTVLVADGKYHFFENNEIVRKWLIIIFGIWGLGLLSLGMYRLIVFIKDEISNYLKK